MPARWLSRLHRAEDGLLAALLGSLLLLSVAQIVLRVVFDAGLPWAEPVSRAGVLYLALLGALQFVPVLAVVGVLVIVLDRETLKRLANGTGPKIRGKK